MKNQSKKSVRWIITMIATLLLVSCFTTACQPTPENDIVINKGDGELQEKIYSEGETIGKPHEAPATWQDELSEGKLNLYIDANIQVPDTNGQPVALIEPDEVTDEDAANFINTVTDGSPLYLKSTLSTKEEIEAQIIEIQRIINDPNSDFNVVMKGTPEYDEKLKEYQDRLDTLSKQLIDAPEDQAISEVALKFVSLTEIDPTLAGRDEVPVGLGIEGYTEKDGQKYQEISLYKANAPYFDQRIDFYRSDFGVIEPFLTSTITNLRNCKISVEGAQKIAEDFLDKLGIVDMGLNLAASTIQYNPEYDEGKEIISDFSQSYVFHYTRKVNDVEITYQLNQPDPAEQYDAYWPQEVIVIVVNDSGMTQFTWLSPLKVKNIINSNVELLPFSEIQSIFKGNVGRNIDYYDNNQAIIEREIHINRIVLGLTKIKQKDSNEYILVPTWNFFGYEVNKYDGQQPGGYQLDENNSYTQEAVGQSFLTINAIDGSLINTDIGY